jgi:hypothetical protein
MWKCMPVDPHIDTAWPRSEIPTIMNLRWSDQSAETHYQKFTPADIRISSIVSTRRDVCLSHSDLDWE